MPFSPGKLGSILASAATALVAASGVTTEAGQPVQRFVKDIIRTGDYLDPHSGKRFSVTTEDLDHWAKTFSLMDAAGVRVPVPEEHTSKPSANRGYVRAMFREGETLRASIDLIGAAAIALAATNDVSIYVPPSFTDGKGNTYDRPITHVAITTYPVVPGMNPFTPIIASGASGDSAEKAPVLRLATGASSMETLKAIAAACGISADGLDESALAQAITAKIGEWKTKMSAADAKSQTDATALAAAHKSIEELKGEKTREPDPMVLKLSGKNRAMELRQLMTEGYITPDAEKRLLAAWVEGDALKLSLDPNSDGLFEQTVAAIRVTKPTALKAHIDGQTLQLSRVTPGANTDDQPIKADAEVAKRAFGKR